VDVTLLMRGRLVLLAVVVLSGVLKPLTAAHSDNREDGHGDEERFWKWVGDKQKGGFHESLDQNLYRSNAPDAGYLPYSMGMEYLDHAQNSSLSGERMGNLTIAAVQFALALTFRPQSSMLWNNLAGCILGLEQFETAIPLLRHAVALDPQNTLATQQLKEALAESSAGAEKLVEKKTSEKPTTAKKSAGGATERKEKTKKSADGENTKKDPETASGSQFEGDLIKEKILNLSRFSRVSDEWISREFDLGDRCDIAVVDAREMTPEEFYERFVETSTPALVKSTHIVSAEHRNAWFHAASPHDHHQQQQQQQHQQHQQPTVIRLFGLARRTSATTAVTSWKTARTPTSPCSPPTARPTSSSATRGEAGTG